MVHVAGLGDLSLFLLLFFLLFSVLFFFPHALINCLCWGEWFRLLPRSISLRFSFLFLFLALLRADSEVVV